MTYKYSLLGLAAGTALLLATGCSKQESPATPAADNATKSPAPVDAGKAANNEPAVSAKPESAATAAPAPAPKPVAVQPQNPAADQPVAITPVASGGSTASTPASTVQSAFQPQQLSLAQAATNQVQALASAATNRVLGGLGMTNQVASAATNQVEVLLERAKSLSANQKYQEALNTLTQLYSTKLTPEQKQKADALKTQIQTALTQKAAAGASSALGNILGGKK